MKALYLETSAVLAWLFAEAAGNEVLAAIDRADAVATSRLTIVETERAILRAVASRLVKEAAAHKLRGLLVTEQPKWITMSLTAEVLARAGRSFPVEPIRTLDAIHLATALAFAEALPDMQVLAVDRRVRDNAIALGLTLA